MENLSGEVCKRGARKETQRGSGDAFGFGQRVAVWRAEGGGVLGGGFWGLFVGV